MTMPFNLLRARRRLHLNIEQQQLLLADDMQRARYDAAQFRHSLVRSATSPIALGIAAAAGFFTARKLQTPAAPRSSHSEQQLAEQGASAHRSAALSLLINLLAPTLISWLGERLLAMVHRDPVPTDHSAPE